MKALSHVRLFVTPWTVDPQAPPSMGFSRQEYWSGLPFPSPRTVIVTVTVFNWITGKYSGVGNGNSLQYFCLESSMDRGAWWVTVQWVANYQTWLSMQRHAHLSYIDKWSYHSLHFFFQLGIHTHFLKFQLHEMKAMIVIPAPNMVQQSYLLIAC